jgi:hypothetical protein
MAGGRPGSVHGVAAEAWGSGWQIWNWTSARGALAGVQLLPISVVQFDAVFPGPHASKGERLQTDTTRVNVVFWIAT